MRGRRPEPTIKKLLHGVTRRDRLNEDEPFCEPLTRMPPVPPELGEAGRRAWTLVGRRLIRARLLNERFLESFLNFCILADRRAEALEAIRRDGAVLRGKNGLYPNPWQNILSGTIKAMEKIAENFGATPAANSRVSALGGHQGDLFDDFLGERDEPGALRDEENLN